MTAARRGQKAAFSPTAMSTIVKLPAVWPTLSHASTFSPAPPKRPQRRQTRLSVPRDARLKRVSRIREAHVDGPSRLTGLACCGATVLALNYRV